ncbi:hypothetical protein D3C85_1040790 [compost metagenome]
MAQMGEFLAFRFNPNGDVLSRRERSDRFAVCRFQVKGSNQFALAYLTLNHEWAKAVPAAGLLLGILVHFLLDSNKSVRNDPISTAPCINNLIRSCITKNRLDCCQQVLADNRVMLWQNAKRPVLVSNLDYNRKNLFQSINVSCGCIHSVS